MVGPSRTRHKESTRDTTANPAQGHQRRGVHTHWSCRCLWCRFVLCTTDTAHLRRGQRRVARRHRRRHCALSHAASSDRDSLPHCRCRIVGPPTKERGALRSRRRAYSPRDANSDAGRAATWCGPIVGGLSLCLTTASNCAQRSPARSAVIRRRKRCRPMPANIFTTAPDAAPSCVPRQAIAASSAPMQQCHARRSRRAAPKAAAARIVSRPLRLFRTNLVSASRWRPPTTSPALRPTRPRPWRGPRPIAGRTG